jgi:Domain of unknown function (DUF1906)
MFRISVCLCAFFLCIFSSSAYLSAQRTKTPAHFQYVSGADDPAFSDAFLAFHTCDAMSAPDMQVWWKDSPFYAAGVYIGGISRKCRNTVLTSGWVNAVEKQGWGLLPIWVGPQAPCTTFKHKILKDEAELHGAMEALNAANAAEDLGLGGTIIYYDIEYYEPSGDDGTCGRIVKEFLTGWTKQLHDKGFSAGIYGSPVDAQSNFTKVSPLPDDVWLAKTTFAPYTSSDLTIWGLKPLCDPFSLPPCSYWSDGQRVHQYAGEVKQEWGGVNFPCKTKNKSDCVDLDVVDAEFADSPEVKIRASNPEGDKTYTF